MKEPRGFSVVVIDDHELFRQGLQALLQPEFEIRASGSNGDDARRLCSAHKPDLVILDVETNSSPAEVTIRAIRRESPEVVVFVLTMYDDEILRRQLILAGATDYATKAIGRTELISRLRAAIETGPAVVNHAEPTPDGMLTQRELEVIRLVASAASNKDIAQRLSISEGTVKRHLANVFAKLGAASRIDAVARARLHGLLSSAVAPRVNPLLEGDSGGIGPATST